MKKTGLFLILALLLPALLASCSFIGRNDPGTSADGSAVPEDPTETASQTTSSYLTLVEGKTTDYRLYSTLDASETDRFASLFASKTGATLKKTDDPEAGKVIRVGNMEDFSLPPAYTGWYFDVSGERITIALGSRSLSTAKTVWDKALGSFFSRLQKTKNNEWVLSANLNDSGDLTGIAEVVPMLEIGQEHYVGTYDCGAGYYQVTYERITSFDTMKAYVRQLKAEGYAQHSENAINGNRFATYVKDGAKVHMTWFKSKGVFQIEYGKTGYLPPKEAPTDYQKVATPSVAQMKLTETGLSMVFQCEDGSFVIVDGGADGEENRQVLWNYLVSRLPAGETKPRVTWIITHIHGDHIGMIPTFLAEHRNDMILSLAAYRFPNFESTKFQSEETGNYNQIANDLAQAFAGNFPQTPVWSFNTGDQLLLPGGKIEFLYTHPNMYPTDLSWVNDSSSVFCVTLAGKTTMVFGDAENLESYQIYKVYGSTLKSDVMQVPHHGAGTSSWALYSAVDPSICLWSVSKEKFENDPRMLGTQMGMSYNTKLRDPAYGERSHYHESQVTVIELPDFTVTVLP